MKGTIDLSNMANVNTTVFVKEIFRIVRLPDIRRVEDAEKNAAEPGDPALWKGSFPLDAVCIYIYIHTASKGKLPFHRAGSFPLDAVCIYIYIHVILRYINIWGQHLTRIMWACLRQVAMQPTVSINEDTLAGDGSRYDPWYLYDTVLVYIP